MKNLKIIVAFVGIAFLGFHNAEAQQKKIEKVELSTTKSLKSVTLEQLPDAVKKAASSYAAGYKVKKSFVTQLKSTQKVYKVQIARGSIVYDLVIDEKGKVLHMSE